MRHYIIDEVKQEPFHRLGTLPRLSPLTVFASADGLNEFGPVLLWQLAQLRRIPRREPALHGLDAVDLNAEDEVVWHLGAGVDRVLGDDIRAVLAARRRRRPFGGWWPGIGPEGSRVRRVAGCLPNRLLRVTRLSGPRMFLCGRVTLVRSSGVHATHGQMSRDDKCQDEDWTQLFGRLAALGG